jgi:HEAT repeat protein
VRGQLAAALGRVEGDQVVNVLTELLDDENPSVRIAAARALGGLTDQAAPQALGRILVSGTDPALRQAALEALAARPDEAARDYLRRVAARSGDPMADAARQVLSGELAPPAAETVDPAVPCVHPAGLQKGCLKK